MNSAEIRACLEELPDGTVTQCRFMHGQYGRCQNTADHAIKAEVFVKIKWPSSRDFVLHGRAMCMEHIKFMLNNFFPGKI